MEKLICDLISMAFMAIAGKKEFITYDAIYTEISSLSIVAELKLAEPEVKAIVEHIYAIRIGFQQSL